MVEAREAAERWLADAAGAPICSTACAAPGASGSAWSKSADARDRDCAIIAGTLKGRRLTAPTWPGLRPTSDRLRETLFNILGASVPGARVLDAFAGTGAVGIEALSRGAAHVMFVDRDPRAIALIRREPRRTAACPDGYAIIRWICGPRRARGRSTARSISSFWIPRTR